MSEVERAKAYIGIFIAAGDDWPDCVPVDGRVMPDGAVRIGSIELRHEGNGVWSLHDGDIVKRYQAATAAS